MLPCDVEQTWTGIGRADQARGHLSGFFINVSSEPTHCHSHLLLLLFRFPHGDDESKEVRERAGIIVHYNVKIRCIVSFGR